MASRSRACLPALTMLPTLRAHPAQSKAIVIVSCEDKQVPKGDYQGVSSIFMFPFPILDLEIALIVHGLAGIRRPTDMDVGRNPWRACPARSHPCGQFEGQVWAPLAAPSPLD